MPNLLKQKRRSPKSVENRIYLAHGTRKYRTEEERVMIQLLGRKYPKMDILNPAWYQPSGPVKLTRDVEEFLRTDSCGRCTRTSCQIGWFLNLVQKSKLLAIWRDGASCGVACEERFAKFIKRKTVEVTLDVGVKEI